MISDIVHYFHRLISWLTLRNHLPYDMYICAFVHVCILHPSHYFCNVHHGQSSQQWLFCTERFFNFSLCLVACTLCATSCAEINKLINLEPLEVIWGPLWSIERRLRPCFATSASIAQLISAQIISAQFISVQFISPQLISASISTLQRAPGVAPKCTQSLKCILLLSVKSFTLKHTYFIVFKYMYTWCTLI